MRNFMLFLVLSASIAFWGCGGEGGSSASSAAFQINGNISNADNLQIFFDKMSFSNANNVIQKVDIGSGGDFSIGLEEHPGEGIYRMRIGTKKGYFVFDGSEKVVEVNGSLEDFDLSKQQVKGSTSTTAYLSGEQKLKSQELNMDNFGTFVSSNDGLVSAYLAYNLMGRTINGKTIAALEQVEAKLKVDHPTSKDLGDFSGYVRGRAAKLEQLSIGQVIPVENRRQAKEINFPSPSGNNYSLDDLKGKVVLIDFWASWCRPCRAANPHVVGLYDRFNKDGFEVFSVSLDGSKDRWEQAIKQDNLKWPYHVSDLKKWQSAPAREYGVSSIPRTFLLDREGRIAAVNPRGKQLDMAIEKLLNG